MTQNTIGPSKFTTARPISAPYSSCSSRSDSGEPSKPERFASTTMGRFPLAALIARATFFEARGMSVPHHRDLGVAHRGPALEGRVVLVDRRGHHLADVERALPSRVVLVAEDV